MTRRLTAAIALTLLLVAVFATPGHAQQPAPLQKSDLIRLLSGATYTKAEVAGIIEQSCLSFTPTERDRADFRALGADAAVMTAIDRCGTGPDLTLSLQRTDFTVPAGGSVAIPVQVRRGGASAAGVGLGLIGSESIRGGSGRRVTTVTDAQGNASFQLPVGTAVARYNLTIDAGEQSLDGPRAVTVRVAPGAATQATVAPDPIVVQGAETQVRVVVRDRYGNPVPSSPVRLAPAGVPGAAALAEGTTSTTGELVVSLPSSVLAQVQGVAVLSGDAALAELRVALGRLPEAEAAFVAGTGQSADVGRPVSEPLVLEVRDTEGRAAAGREVRFSARNGTVAPEVVVTDAEGRAAVRVTVGESGEEAEVVARVGELERSTRVTITRGGMTGAEFDATLAEGAALLATGDADGARSLYERLASAQPERLEPRIGIAESFAVAGRYEEAVERYRSILRLAPSRYDAQVGMARASLGAGDAETAARWYELGLSQNRGDARVWVGLGDARADLGRRDEAREAYEQALAIDPGNEDARGGLGRLAAHPLLLEADVWGGNTFDNGRDASVRWAELRIHPVGGLELWGGFDNALNFRHPYLVRGNVDIEAGYGGVAYGWGSDRKHRTAFEYGRRTHPVGGTIQSTWTLSQRVGIAGGSWVRFEGWLGHWYDRDDWVVYGEAGIRAGSGLTLRPMLSYGDYAGSTVSRDPAKEFRAGLALRYEAGTGWGIEPGFAYGSVSSDVNEALDGSLWDATARLWYAFSPQVALDGFVRYQSPPGEPADVALTDFWTVGLGLRLGVARPH